MTTGPFAVRKGDRSHLQAGASNRLDVTLQLSSLLPLGHGTLQVPSGRQHGGEPEDRDQKPTGVALRH